MLTNSEICYSNSRFNLPSWLDFLTEKKKSYLFNVQEIMKGMIFTLDYCSAVDLPPI